MASKVNKKKVLNAQGILDTSDGILKLEIEDQKDKVVLADLVKEFDGMEVKISVTYAEDIA